MQREILYEFLAHDAQAAPGVLNDTAGHPTAKPVANPRLDFSRQRVFPAGANAADYIGGIFLLQKSGQHHRQVSWIVLQVGVYGRDDFSS